MADSVLGFNLLLPPSSRFQVCGGDTDSYAVSAAHWELASSLGRNLSATICCEIELRITASILIRIYMFSVLCFIMVLNNDASDRSVMAS